MLEPCRFEDRLHYEMVPDTTGVIEPVSLEHPERIVNGPDRDKEATGSGTDRSQTCRSATIN
jgi:hypothetical protein